MKKITLQALIIVASTSLTGYVYAEEAQTTAPATQTEQQPAADAQKTTDAEKPAAPEKSHKTKKGHHSKSHKSSHSEKKEVKEESSEESTRGLPKAFSGSGSE